MEQRAVIKFHAKLGTSATSTYRLMQQVYGNDCLSRTTTFNWHKRFVEGRKVLDDDGCTGRPSVETPKLLKKMEGLMENNGNVSYRKMATALNVSKETVRRIILTKGLRRTEGPQTATNGQQANQSRKTQARSKKCKKKPSVKRNGSRKTQIKTGKIESTQVLQSH